MNAEHYVLIAWGSHDKNNWELVFTRSYPGTYILASGQESSPSRSHALVDKYQFYRYEKRLANGTFEFIKEDRNN